MRSIVLSQSRDAYCRRDIIGGGATDRDRGVASLRALRLTWRGRGRLLLHPVALLAS
jgi:hypothetical protein